MYPDQPNTNGHSSTRPSQNQYPSTSSGSKRRQPTQEEPSTVNLTIPPLSDYNSWYYPSNGYDSDEEDSRIELRSGNWGNKHTKGARWLRKGKIAPWGPGMEEWEAQERARKRLKLMLPQTKRSPTPPSIPHLARSPSPPLVSPYPPPQSAHLSYSSFVMDKAVTHTFRSRLIDELEQATNGLIEGEASLRTALGRLWQVMNEDPDLKKKQTTSVVPKREDEDMHAEGEDPRNSRVARAPDLTPSTHKIFLLSHTNGSAAQFDASHFTVPERQLESLEKSLATLRELQDDGREYVERLQEIREGLGDVRAQRNVIWDVVRERAIQEMQDTAFVIAGSNTQ
ncbi:hypothetical protein FA15DRAFT_625837 [Coprinopsis marcescibilis]|uniref:Transcriptional regulatory protein RXT2 N-terminal domain-containing protein n=1 Tax=Coprinopsis marcescibilis TaxID=230819 RepID=A0A5C3KJS2_COPMA|nr:hypothetical protein FA15DRAFT_625837 [Coprinopsis marcescibilis]